MNKEELTAKLKVIIKPYTTNTDAYENLTENTDFIHDLNINSANLVDIILDIEEEFNIIIENTDMERMLDVKTSIAIIETKLAAK
ncbi:acyl carrier protein [Flavobacterium sp. ST-87]|uniref:Acyl carrier protein n=1 Tax=Flavobacterium plantiphilum TaxID=3163297 RepID=A0ABW8XXF1_9FLAO